MSVSSSPKVPTRPFAAVFAVPLVGLDSIQRTDVPSERISFDAEPLMDGDKELCQWQLFRFDLASPPGIRDDSCASSIVFVAFADCYSRRVTIVTDFVLSCKCRC